MKPITPVDFLIAQFAAHPETSNAVVVKTERTAHAFMRSMHEALGDRNFKPIPYGAVTIAFNLADQPAPEGHDPLFAIYVEGSKSIIGSRITGILLVDVFQLDESYWRRNVVTRLTRGGAAWYPFSADNAVVYKPLEIFCDPI